MRVAVLGLVEDDLSAGVGRNDGDISMTAASKIPVSESAKRLRHMVVIIVDPL